MPTTTLIVRQLLLYIHTLAFAFAVVGVLRANVALLTARRVDPGVLERHGKLLGGLLAVLWLTGVGLVLLDNGADLRRLATLPQMGTKLLVVALLTLDGWLLQQVAFPMMTQRQRSRRRAATVCTALGTFGTVSWLFAAFVGGARLVAPLMNWIDFLALWLLALVAGWLVALETVRPRIERQMKRHEPQVKIEHALYATLGRAASLLLDRPTRQAHRGRPWAYAQALAARIPAGMARDRSVFLARIEPYLAARG